jgi:hypothetical protein
MSQDTEWRRGRYVGPGPDHGEVAWIVIHRCPKHPNEECGHHDVFVIRDENHASGHKTETTLDVWDFVNVAQWVIQGITDNIVVYLSDVKNGCAEWCVTSPRHAKFMLPQDAVRVKNELVTNLIKPMGVSQLRIIHARTRALMPRELELKFHIEQTANTKAWIVRGRLKSNGMPTYLDLVNPLKWVRSLDWASLYTEHGARFAARSAKDHAEGIDDIVAVSRETERERLKFEQAFDDCTARITGPTHAIGVMEAALIQAAVWFEEYAKLHQAKATPDPEKVATNQNRAAYLRQVVQRCTKT